MKKYLFFHFLTFTLFSPSLKCMDPHFLDTIINQARMNHEQLEQERRQQELLDQRTRERKQKEENACRRATEKRIAHMEFERDRKRKAMRKSSFGSLDEISSLTDSIGEASSRASSTTSYESKSPLESLFESKHRTHMKDFVAKIQQYFETDIIPQYPELEHNEHKICVTVDIDKTTLDTDQPLTPKSGQKYASHLYAAIPEMLALYQWLTQTCKIHVHFITARTHESYHLTIRNLNLVGYKTFHAVHCMPSAQYHTRQHQTDAIVAFKEETRQRLVTDGWTILATFDDRPEILFDENETPRKHVGKAFLVPIGPL